MTSDSAEGWQPGEMKFQLVGNLDPDSMAKLWGAFEPESGTIPLGSLSIRHDHLPEAEEARQQRDEARCLAADTLSLGVRLTTLFGAVYALAVVVAAARGEHWVGVVAKVFLALVGFTAGFRLRRAERAWRAGE